nr:T9SS type A sorting domain-containing protein [Chitinophagaceae bacterium]
YYNHSFPPCDIIDSFLHLSPTIPLSTQELSLPQIRYANPIQNELMIQLPPFAKEWQYALINLQGIIVKSGKLNADQNHVQVADLSDGVYVLQLKHQSGQYENHKVLIRN